MTAPKWGRAGKRVSALLCSSLCLISVFNRPASAETFGLDADECAIQRALLGKAGPQCPPPPSPTVEVVEPEPEPVPVPAEPAPVPLAVAPPSAPPTTPVPRPPEPHPPTPPPIAVAEPAPESRRAAFLILFQFGSATLTDNSKALIDRIASVMRVGLNEGGPDGDAVRFRVVGHTDATGGAAANLALSRRRAEAVREHLITKGGIPADRLEADGRGEAELADSAHPGAAANRRVEIITVTGAASGNVDGRRPTPGR